MALAYDSDGEYVLVTPRLSRAEKIAEICELHCANDNCLFRYENGTFYYCRSDGYELYKSELNQNVLKMLTYNHHVFLICEDCVCIFNGGLRSIHKFDGIGGPNCVVFGHTPTSFVVKLGDVYYSLVWQSRKVKRTRKLLVQDRDGRSMCRIILGTSGPIMVSREVDRGPKCKYVLVIPKKISGYDVYPIGEFESLIVSGEHPCVWVKAWTIQSIEMNDRSVIFEDLRGLWIVSVGGNPTPTRFEGTLERQVRQVKSARTAI